MKALSTMTLLVGLLTGLPGQATAQATVEGVVKAPPAQSAPPASARYESGQVIGKPEPAVAVVYLEGNFPPATGTVTAEMGQKQLQFAPGLLVIQKGTKVEFPNYDDLYHNVFSYSKAKRFDLGRYLKTEKPAAQQFDQPGVIKLFCEIHEHMRGTILVLDTPYFKKADTNGVFRLENLPAGKFVLKAWLNEKTVLEMPVQLKEGETLKVDFPGPSGT